MPRFDVAETHECPEMNDDYTEEAFWGSAVNRIQKAVAAYDDENAPTWYAHNREYGTRIRFCPFCGKELAVDAQPVTIRLWHLPRQESTWPEHPNALLDPERHTETIEIHPPFPAKLFVPVLDGPTAVYRIDYVFSHAIKANGETTESPFAQDWYA